MRNKTRLLKIKYRWLGNMLVVLLVALFWNRRSLSHFALLQPFTMMHQLCFGTLMFMLLQCTSVIGKYLICLSFALELARLSFLLLISQLQSVFLSLLSFVIMTKNLETQITQSSDKIAKVTCSSWAPVTWARWWRPGRAETSRRNGGWASLNSFTSSSVGCSGFADWLLPLLSLLTFPVASSLCSGRCWVCASPWS